MDIVFYIEIGGGGNGGQRGGVADLLSFGEREHALSFARSIQKAGYRPRFVVGPRIASHILVAGFEPEVFWSTDQGVKLVQDIDPAMIIGCELFNLSTESARGLIDMGKPMGTMDGTTLALEINSNPFKSPQYTRGLTLPDYYTAFRPCPVNDVGPDTDRVFHFSLFRDVGRVPKDEQLYASMNLDPSRKTVMFAAAPWAMVCAANFGLEEYYQKLVGRLVDGLDAYGEPIDLVFISVYRPAVLTIEGKGAVRVRYTGLLPYDRYDHLLASCDAIVSDNIIQTSVSKAIAMGTPHLIVQNMHPSEMPYEYNMFPVKLLFPTEREYSRIVDVAEFGDVPGIRDRLLALLQQGFYDSGARDRRRQYLTRLNSLTEPGDILERIIGPADVAVAGAS
jgi:hypothetical protein